MISCGVNKKTPFFIIIFSKCVNINQIAEIISRLNEERGGVLIVPMAGAMVVHAQEAGTEKTAELTDTVPPVIEKVEFDQNGAVLHPGDTVSMKIYTYDLDSGMDRAYATVFMTGAGDMFQQNLSAGEYDEEEQSFTLEWVIPETYHTLGEIHEIGVSDKEGNIAQWETTDEQQQPLYQYKMERQLLLTVKLYRKTAICG